MGCRTALCFFLSAALRRCLGQLAAITISSHDDCELSSLGGPRETLPDRVALGTKFLRLGVGSFAT